MAKAKKTDVQFVLPDPEPENVDNDNVMVEEEFEEPPYTSIEHSVASGEGCVAHQSDCSCARPV